MALSDYIDFSSFEWRKCLSAVVAFVFIGIIDVSGVVFGMAKLGDLMLADGTIPGSLYAFVGVSGGTVIGAAVGSAPCIVYVETAAGIKEGGRTGLTAVVVSVYFVLSLLLAPLFSRCGDAFTFFQARSRVPHAFAAFPIPTPRAAVSR